jgi:hypothetical protein
MSICFTSETTTQISMKFGMMLHQRDCICGMVVKFPGYRCKSPGFDSRRYLIFWEVVGLERGPLSLMSTTEELHEWKSSGCGSRKPRLTVMGICCADLTTPSICKKLARTSLTSGGHSVGIVHVRAKAMEVLLLHHGLWMNLFTLSFYHAVKLRLYNVEWYN